MSATRTSKYDAELRIYQEAQAAAAEAARQMVGQNPGHWYPCGFSWVRIRPAAGRFVAMCKQHGFGSTDEFEGGFVIYNPSENSTQWMDAKMAGSRAFVQVLKKHYPNMKVVAQERID